MILTAYASLLLIGRQSSATWDYFAGDSEGSRYSRLEQITPENVKNLQVAWTYTTGEEPGKVPIQCTPFVIGNRMYVVTGHHHIVCLNPATGAKVWEFDSKTDLSKSGHARSSRGLAYWESKGKKRIVYGTPDGRILSVDVKTGQPDPQFNPVNLRKELSVSESTYVGVSAAPTIYKNLVYVGIATGEDENAAPGDIMAFDLNSGKRVWKFEVLPSSGSNPRHPSIGAAGAWNGYSLDSKTGTLFAATGSAAPDFNGTNRPGNNEYANCVLAIDAATGKLRWHFQTVHHDIFDYDNASAPLLCSLKRNGKTVTAVAQFTKSGYCFILDRNNGKPIFGVKEVPVPRSTDPHEKSSATQPIPLKPPPITKTVFTLDEVTNISTQSREFVLNKLKPYAFGSPFSPPTPKGTINLPGYMGGSPWSGASFDPASRTIFVNSNNVAAIISHPANYVFLTDQNGYPGNKPPWGLLTAISADTGNIKWQVPLGEYEELTKQGVPKTGTLNFGGTLVTATNLLFIGATSDSKFRAFDTVNGKILWQFDLPASAYAAPMTYQINGRQYITIASSGGGYSKLFGFDKGKTSNQFITFALPINSKFKRDSR
jgi:quinoprotein glucose dehydrogenase